MDGSITEARYSRGRVLRIDRSPNARQGLPPTLSQRIEVFHAITSWKLATDGFKRFNQRFTDNYACQMSSDQYKPIPRT